MWKLICDNVHYKSFKVECKNIILVMHHEGKHSEVKLWFNEFTKAVFTEGKIIHDIYIYPLCTSCNPYIFIIYYEWDLHFIMTYIFFCQQFTVLLVDDHILLLSLF